MDADGNIVTWNAQAERTFGWSRDEVLGRHLAEIIIPLEFREAHTRGMERFLDDRRRAGRQPAASSCAACIATGDEFPIEITITSPMRRENGFFFGAFLRDISDRRRARRRAAHGEGRRRSRDPRQERVPGQHEPRAAHAAERRALATRSCCSAIAD